MHGRNARRRAEPASRYERRRERPGARRARRRGGRRGAGILLAHADDLDAVVLGGDRFALAAVLEDPRLRRLAAVTSDRVLDVPDPRLVASCALRRTVSAPTMLTTLDPRPAPPAAARL